MDTQEKTPLNYSDFFERFKHKQGFIGDVVTTKYGVKAFQVELDSEQDNQEVREYLKGKNVLVNIGLLNKKKTLVYFLK